MWLDQLLRGFLVTVLLLWVGWAVVWLFRQVDREDV
jgi:hypothetical protein